MNIIGILKIVSLAGIIIFVIGMFGYVKVPTDKVCFVSGLRKRRVNGRIAFYLRWFERVDYIDLSAFSVDVNTSEAVPTNDFISIKADAVAKLQIDETGLDIASKNFLNKKSSDISNDVKDVLEGNLREIIGQLTLEAIVQDRKGFNAKVQENVASDLKEMGLKVISFTIQNFQENESIIASLAQQNTSKIIEASSIAKATADKNVAIAQAMADKEANDERVKAETEIAIKQNELNIKRSELKIKADTERANADATYEIQSQIKRKEIETATGEADFQKEEINIKTEKARLEAQVKNEQEIKADADLYKKTKDAEAIKIEAQAKAEAKRIEAEAEAEAIRIRAKANAEAKEQEGLAEAKALQAKFSAEAEGLNKKAEAMKKYGEGAIFEMYFKALPEIAKNIASPLEKVDKITMYGEGNGAKMVGDITKMIEKVNSGVGDSLGIDLKSVIGGYLGKGFLDKIKDNSLDVTPKVEETK